MTEQPSCDVLVVEDDTVIRSMLKHVLEQDGYTVIGATNGADALDTLHNLSSPPCVILLDLNMPIMTGWEFRLEQKRHAQIADIPVAIISSQHNPEQSCSIDAIGYFRKPIDIPGLLALTKRCRKLATMS